MGGGVNNQNAKQEIEKRGDREPCSSCIGKRRSVSGPRRFPMRNACTCSACVILSRWLPEQGPLALGKEGVQEGEECEARGGGV
jgi:hypothetical protein